MAADSQKGLSPVMPESPPAAGLADPLAYAQVVIPLPVVGFTDPPPSRPATALDIEHPVDRPSVPSVIRRHPFEVYVVGQASDGAWPTVKCAWGTVCKPHTADGATTIAGRTDSFTLEEDALFWLETVFDEDGAITSCDLMNGTTSAAWTEYPEQFSADGLTWYHPIAHIRAALGTPRESGEVAIHSSGAIIAQLTNTHLRVGRACGMDEAMTVHWKLEPGPGAIV